MFLKYVLSQGLGELAAGNDCRNEPQSNALLRTTLRYPLVPRWRRGQEKSELTFPSLLRRGGQACSAEFGCFKLCGL